MASTSPASDVLRAVPADPKAIMTAPSDLLRDESFIKRALEANPMCLLYVSEWRQDWEWALIALRLRPTIYMHLRPPSSQVTAVIREALRLRGLNLGKVPSWCRDDTDLVTLAVKNDGRSLQYASDRLRADDAVLEQAIASNPEAIHWATAPSDERVRQAIERGCAAAFKYASSDMRANRDIAAKVVRSDASMCMYVLHTEWPSDSVEFDTVEKMRKRFRNKRDREG